MTRSAHYLCQVVSNGLRPIACLAASGFLMLGALRTASACVTSDDPRYIGDPADGAVDIPTDVVLTVNGSALGMSEQDLSNIDAVLVADNGDEVAVAIEHPYVWSYTLVPERELRPETTYGLTLSWPGASPADIHFTTGTGPLGEPPSPPAAVLQHYRIVEGPETSCSPWPTGTCVAVPDDVWVQARAIDEFGQFHEPHLYQGAYLTNLIGIDQDTYFRCVELRSRAPNGSLSDEVTLCGDDAPLFEFNDEQFVECTSEGFPDARRLEPDARPQEADDADASSVACVAAGSPGGGRAATWLLLALVGLARRRRSRAPNR
jgi:hypothetical protein